MSPIYLHQFKSNPSGVAPVGLIAATFVSSGTTSEQRSKVEFSKQGLANYKKRCLKTIALVLEHKFLRAKPGTLYSLIPSIEKWPHSSLARMIHWFGEEYGVEYIEDASSIPTDSPVWVFGTALHYLHAIDCGKAQAIGSEPNRQRLHKDSILFETGGFKAERTELTKSELYDGMQKYFGVSENNIVSEYGSCELSAQAYDCYAHKSSTNADKRAFEFHPDVRLSVLQNNGAFSRQGIGSLVVDDPLRTDLSGPIITEDLVDLQENGQFELLGRVVSKKLRGCSLMAEQQLAKKPSGSAEFGGSLTAPTPFNLEAAKQNLAKAQRGLKNKDFQQNILRILTQEITSKNAAQFALQNFLVDPVEGFSPNLEQVYCNAFSENSPDHWDCILPGNHSIAAWEPLLIAALFGKKLHIYLPPAKEVRDSVACFVESYLRPLGADVTAHNTNWVPHRNHQEHGVLVFGRDETVTWFSQQTNYVAGHGSNIAGIHCKSLGDILLPHFIHESFALGHTGCFENRFIISEEPATPKQVDALQKAFLDFWGSRLSNKQTQALLHQKNLYESSFEGAKIHSSEGGLLIPYLSKAADFRRVLSSAPFCLPVISADTYRSLEVPSEVSVDQRVCSNKDPKINAQFDGMHQGKGLFKPS